MQNCQYNTSSPDILGHVTIETTESLTDVNKRHPEAVRVKRKAHSVDDFNPTAPKIHKTQSATNSEDEEVNVR